MKKLSKVWVLQGLDLWEIPDPKPEIKSNSWWTGRRAPKILKLKENLEIPVPNGTWSFLERPELDVKVWTSKAPAVRIYRKRLQERAEELEESLGPGDYEELWKIYQALDSGI